MADGVLKGSVFYAAWAFLVIGLLTLVTGNVAGIGVAAVSLGALYWATEGEPFGGRVKGY